MRLGTLQGGCSTENARVRTRVEHCIRRVKEYGAVSHLWRHERWMFPNCNRTLLVLSTKAHPHFTRDLTCL